MTILHSLSISHQNLFALEIHIFDPQPDAFHQPQPGAVQQFGHCLHHVVVNQFNHGDSLFAGKNGWHGGGTFGANRIDPVKGLYGAIPQSRTLDREHPEK